MPETKTNGVSSIFRPQQLEGIGAAEMRQRIVANHHVPVSTLDGLEHRFRPINALENDIVSTAAQLANKQLSVVFRIFDDKDMQSGAHATLLISEGERDIQDQPIKASCRIASMNWAKSTGLRT